MIDPVDIKRVIEDNSDWNFQLRNGGKIMYPLEFTNGKVLSPISSDMKDGDPYTITEEGIIMYEDNEELKFFRMYKEIEDRGRAKYRFIPWNTMDQGNELVP